MTTLEKIRAEIDEQTEIHSDGEFYIKNIDVKRILAKYAEQEPCRDMEEIREVMGCDVDAETKCKMIFNILTAKPHYFAEQEPTIGQLFSCEEVEELRNKIWKQVEQEPCDDVVSRQAVLASIKNLYPDMPIMDIFGARRKWLDKYAPYFECENAVEQLPSVRPQEQTGHWIKISPAEIYECSECGQNVMTQDICAYKYCHGCGADMRKLNKI